MVVTAQRIWQLAHGRALDLKDGALMAIINVTPDSFSDGGLLKSTAAAVDHALACVAGGADILDIGGESTRPGAVGISAAEEQDRVLPVIEALAARTDALMSIDTYRASTARLAVAAGAHVINDVHGAQREPEIAKVAAETGAGLCLMHTGRGRDKLSDVIADQILFLGRSLDIADAAGVARSAVVLDPGFGFAKDPAENMELMARFAELHGFGLPLIAGTSRKRFIGTMTGEEMADRRDAGTAATTVYLRQQGAAIFRVHNVAINRDALAVANAMLDAEARLTLKPDLHA
nr:dihydropteroate synthase [uncultured Gellertiella sp.]